MTNGGAIEQYSTANDAWLRTSSGGLNLLDTTDASMALGRDGILYVMTNGGAIEQYSTADDAWLRTSSDGLVQSLAEGNDGNAYYLQNGSVYNATTGADVHDGVRTLAQGPAGQLWLDLGPDGLCLYNPAASSYASYGVVQAFAVSVDGNAYYLHNGNLYFSAISSPIATAVESFVVDGFGSVLALIQTQVGSRQGARSRSWPPQNWSASPRARARPSQRRTSRVSRAPGSAPTA
jgi:hypothetical protein